MKRFLKDRQRLLLREYGLPAEELNNDDTWYAFANEWAPQIEYSVALMRGNFLSQMRTAKWAAANAAMANIFHPQSMRAYALTQQLISYSQKESS